MTSCHDVHLLTGLGLGLVAVGVTARPLLSRGTHFPLGSLCSSGGRHCEKMRTFTSLSGE